MADCVDMIKKIIGRQPVSVTKEQVKPYTKEVDTSGCTELPKADEQLNVM